jgi:SAM-dependent methyltransferase
MAWRRYLLVPRLVLASLGAPRNQARAWNRFWSGVRRTGADGDVLWDVPHPDEAGFTEAQLRTHADLGLPMVDLGCGNGSRARALAAFCPRVVGVDVSAAAIERARSETAANAERAGTVEYPGVEFRVADAADPALGSRLAAEIGDANVHVRGVLHVVPPPARPAVVRNIAYLLGRRGTLFLSETNAPGHPLDYLATQGVTATRMPAMVHRLVASGVRAPSHFGAAEVAGHFAQPPWQVLAEGPTTMYGLPVRPGDEPQHIPSYFAVLRVADAAKFEDLQP